MLFPCFGSTAKGCIKYFWVPKDQPACAGMEKDPVVSCHTCHSFTSQGQRELGVHQAPFSRSFLSP